MKVGVIIFVILLCGIVLVEAVSLVKKIVDTRKKKKLQKEKQMEDANIVVSDNVSEPTDK